MEMKEAFKFCPRCGTQGNNKAKFLACPNCGLDTYFSPKPVQDIALQNDKGEYLFAVRSVEPRKGFLDFPGGFVEQNETFEASIRREVKEELGVEIEEVEYLRSSYDEYPFQGINYRVVGVSFYAKLPPNAKITPADDVASVEFYKLSDVPMDRLAWYALPGLLKILAKREAKQP